MKTDTRKMPETRTNRTARLLGAVLAAIVLLAQLCADAAASQASCPDQLALQTDGELLSEARLTLPGKADASKEKAISEAKRWFTESRFGGLKPGDEASLDASAWFFFHNRFNYGYEPVWLVYLFQKEELLGKVLLGFNADLIEAVQGKADFIATDRWDEGFGIRFSELNFETYSVEEKAAFSEKWIPIVEDRIKKNPYYPARNDEFYQMTRHRYGIPAKGDVPQEEARRIALKTIIALGADPDSAQDREIEYAFDVTKPEQPEWRLFVNFVKDAVIELPRLEGKDFVRIASPYRVILDGKTGEVKEAFIITSQMNVSDFAD